MPGPETIPEHQPIGAPQDFAPQTAIDASGHANRPDIGGFSLGWGHGDDRLDGAVASLDLPHPDTVDSAPGFEPLEDIETAHRNLLLEDLITCIRNLTKQLTFGEDWALRRRMRGPLTANGVSDSNGDLIIQMQEVPAGEVWLIDRMIIRGDSASGTEQLFVYDSNNSAPSQTIDMAGPGATAVTNVSDNAEPIPLFPRSRLVFVWSGLDADVNAWVRVLYRSIPA